MLITCVACFWCFPWSLHLCRVLLNSSGHCLSTLLWAAPHASVSNEWYWGAFLYCLTENGVVINGYLCYWTFISQEDSKVLVLLPLLDGILKNRKIVFGLFWPISEAIKGMFLVLVLCIWVWASSVVIQCSLLLNDPKMFTIKNSKPIF